MTKDATTDATEKELASVYKPVFDALRIAIELEAQHQIDQGADPMHVAAGLVTGTTALLASLTYNLGGPPVSQVMRNYLTLLACAGMDPENIKGWELDLPRALHIKPTDN